jgi:hypothetical protein
VITKEKVVSTINEMQDPISVDDIIERILLLEMIEKGIEQSDNQQVINDDELDERINSWQF